MKTQNIRFLVIMAAALILVLIPFAAMKLGIGFKWSGFDFAVFGLMLLGTGLAIEAVLRLVNSLKYRLLVGGAVLFAVFIVWAELAVGLFGSRFAGN